MHTDTTSNWNDAYAEENTKGKIKRERERERCIHIYRFVIHKKVFYSVWGGRREVGMIQCGWWSPLVEKIFPFVALCTGYIYIYIYIYTCVSTITDGLEFLSRIVPLFRDIAYVLHGETLSHRAISAITTSGSLVKSKFPTNYPLFLTPLPFSFQ